MAATEAGGEKHERRRMDDLWERRFLFVYRIKGYEGSALDKANKKGMYTMHTMQRRTWLTRKCQKLCRDGGVIIIQGMVYYNVYIP